MAWVLRVAGWALTLIVMYGTVSVVDYRLKDPDSTLYERIAENLSAEPVSSWLAPSWPDRRAKTGRFLEHLPFFFWPAAVLHRIGFEKGTLLANFLYHLASLGLVFLLGRALGGVPAAWLATFFFALSPIGIQYLVRANHEAAWNVGALGAFWCLARFGDERGRVFRMLFSFFFTFAVLVKGGLALVVLPMALVWWRVARRPMRDLVAIGSGLVLTALVLGAFELSHRSIHRAGFVADYVLVQSANVAHFEDALWRKLVNPLYYASQLAWFGLPGSLILAWGLIRMKRRGVEWPRAHRLIGAVGLTEWALTSMMSKHAARYIFPLYALVQVPAAMTICDRWPQVDRWLERRRSILPFALMAVSILVLWLRVYVHIHHYLFIDPV